MIGLDLRLLRNYTGRRVVKRVMSNGAPIICEGLTFSYPTHPLFDDISFHVETSGFHALIGRSGAGKSTLAKILSGSLTGWSAKTLILPSLVLYCHANERLPAWQNVGGHIREVTPTSSISLLPTLIHMFAMDQSILTHFPHQLSTGESNRLNVIRYLLQDFDILILDEALGNVDEPTRLSILHAIKDMFPTKTFLYLSHSLLEVTAYSKVIILLAKGFTKGDLRRVDGLNLANYTAGCTGLVANRLEEVMDYV